VPHENPTEDYPEETQIVPFTGDQMDVVVEVSKHLAEYERAIDTIMNFIVRRTYAGDWVSHDKESTPIEDRTVNMIGAAAERIARDLGIQESNRTPCIKIMNEKFPGHYSYQCEGDFTFRGRTVHAVGVASTRNPFYSRAYGADKKPQDIREEYVQRESWRDCTKQGIKMLFGLRRIPILKLQEMGYNLAKVKYVNFKEGEKSVSATNKNATAAPAATEKLEEAGNTTIIQIDEMTLKQSKNGTPFHTVKDTEGATYYKLGGEKDPGTRALLKAWDDNQPIEITYENDGKYLTIKTVKAS
jgi:hypothetical protein